ncbi:MAG: flagellar basal body rod C-terminal domain-containing protein [Nitrospinota bacterium]
MDFKDPDRALRKDGGLYASASGVEPQAAEKVDVRSETLERSNVATVPSLTEMIEVMRAFEAYNKVIQTLNEATQRASTEVGRLR